jgi:putative glutamine amidotransferase
MPPAYSDAEFDVGMVDYSDAVARVGGVPVHLARDCAPDLVLDHLHGLVLTGGADVDPETFGHARSDAVGRTEPKRDAWESALLAEACRRRTPVLAICRGMQLLNVANGGSLIDDIPDAAGGDGHARFGAPRRQSAHEVTFVGGSLAESVYGNHVVVNSLHHQGIDRVGDGLVVTGRSPDGMVESMERPGYDLLAVQWHPEALADDPGVRWLVDAARGYLSDGATARPSGPG